MAAELDPRLEKYAELAVRVGANVAPGQIVFVATGDGGHNFSQTLGGHNQNVSEYRQKISAQRRQNKKKN